MLTHIKDAKKLAESAVRDGDDTLKKANNTYHLLQSFQSEVQKSSENAKIALKDVPSITQQIQDTEDIIKKAEEACKRISVINANNLTIFFRRYKSHITMLTRQKSMQKTLKNDMLIKLQRFLIFLL